jgi:hypothetical protein
MALTDAQTAYLRSKLGTQFDAADLEARLVRLDGDLAKAALEVLDQRLADLVSKPASFSVPGEYSEDRSANIRALTATADALRADTPGADPGYTVRTVDAAQRSFR